ncbi:hypothetical protein PRIPAC_89067, partial [Pristionchus pacificus]|uniref:Uncharacterized protein n=1 Tax=Pristionchus pacificus TaxID=54126 RepID=A0A2A6B770_PRIPA
MAQSTLFVALCVFAASAFASKDLTAHFLAPRNLIPKSLQVKNYPGQCTAADQTKTKSCLDSYFLTYGIDSSKGLPGFSEYMKRTESVIIQYGAAGFDFYCDFESTLETCLGSLMTSACMNPDGFVKMYGLEQLEAINYATSYPVESYTCQYKDLAKSYYPCMMDMQNDGLQGLVDCTLAMSKEFENATDTCVPIDHYVTCIENYYVQYCDEGIRSYICNTQEIAFNFDMDGMCQNKMHQSTFFAPVPSLPQKPNYPGHCSLSDEQTTKKCLNAYFAAYGIDATKGLPDYYEYQAKITSITDNYGVQGYDIYCDYECTLETCLGKLMNSSCMNPNAFTIMYKTNQANSINYATSFPVEAYTCANKEVVKENYDCMVDVSKNHFQGIIDCSNALNAALPGTDDTCGDLSTYILCMEDLYVGLCGPSMKGFICNTQEISFNFDMNNFCEGKMPDCEALIVLSSIVIRITLCIDCQTNAEAHLPDAPPGPAAGKL